MKVNVSMKREWRLSAWTSFLIFVLLMLDLQITHKVQFCIDDKDRNMKISVAEKTNSCSYFKEAVDMFNMK